MQVPHKSTVKTADSAPAKQDKGGQRAANSKLTLVTLAPACKKAKRSAVNYEFSGIAG